ncbi:hypothetical protein JCM19239_4808 [Vibrio variabilis]|uniref:Uncharacterized protein n=1 Tax=Vibrio variabilis TaxID=990271 RepID=A0ABQ0JGJ3_9VIBR|nr:hypothetical protein JCM19239_4808 [Vibrio variabilis]
MLPICAFCTPIDQKLDIGHPIDPFNMPIMGKTMTLMV